jgi:hypothetical protein
VNDLDQKILKDHIYGFYFSQLESMNLKGMNRVNHDLKIVTLKIKIIDTTVRCVVLSPGFAFTYRVLHTRSLGSDSGNIALDRHERC